MAPSEPGGAANDPHVLAALADVLDPAVGINIVDFGLVYRARFTAAGIEVDIGVPSSCPAATRFGEEVRAALGRRFPEVRAIQVAVLTDRPWSLDRLTDNGRRAFGEAMEDAAADPWAGAAIGAGRLN